MPVGFAEDDRLARALDARRVVAVAIRRGPQATRRSVANHGASFDLRVGADRACPGAIGAEAFSYRDRRACAEGAVPERNLFLGGFASRRSQPRGNSTVKR